MMQHLRGDFVLFEAEGTVFGSMSKKDFQAVAVVVPPDVLIQRFEHIAHPLDQQIEHNEQQTRTLAALRDALLPKLLSGAVAVGAEGVV
jgi:type I restriction enzyme S subunit